MRECEVSMTSLALNPQAAGRSLDAESDVRLLEYLGLSLRRDSMFCRQVFRESRGERRFSLRVWRRFWIVDSRGHGFH